MLERTTFRTTAALLPDAVVMTDAEGRILWTNRAFHDLCGYSKKAVKLRKPGSFLQGPDTDLQTVQHIRKSLKARRAVEAEILNYHSDGHPYWVSLRISPIWGENGQLEGFLAIERDITMARCREHHLQEEVGQLYSTLVRIMQAEDQSRDPHH